eukprot:CAMPEP_0202906202 /NCGR_PEP_ID=MMETSP1392-20130828/37761_1 /ASSEMBLY_ACC=CAM_ASM_000868 /TAXON_ID=225041 /ORGANISM="Chlamydomonas chlamydogama, Strain SAG 11-48b" /LENGTH=139 /DNA_ID=CAMNT_0049594593 /DNA_START=316 /DNA_END=735 /DNA_ORIENTATION=+
MCQGRGSVPCKACNGTGRLGRGGYNKKTTLNMSKILHSKWTAMQETLGWRHFRVMQMRKGTAGVTFLLLQASCDPTQQLWLNSAILKDRAKWAAGWLQMSEMQDPQATLATGVPCRTCSSSGIVPCPQCDASGVAVIDV